MTTLHDLSARAADGSALALSQFAGKVLLMVNVASRCGFTAQYAGLQALQARYEDQGFSVLAFPCNQFGAQEPGDAAQIASFCQTTYDVRFPVLAKIEVNGAGADPVWEWLKAARPGLMGTRAIKWNFTKFLLDRRGVPVDRFPPTTPPAALSERIEALLRA